MSDRPAVEALTSELLRDDPELRDVVEEFVQSLPARLVELREAIAAKDVKALTTLTHRLKGAGGSYGYPQISALCAGVEQKLRSDQSVELEKFLGELSVLFDGAVSGLQIQPRA